MDVTYEDPLSARLSRIRHLSGTSGIVAADTATATGQGSAYGTAMDTSIGRGT
jgi:hypothetical protein